MAKRSDGQFERRKNDVYDTWDPRALPPLLAHLAPQTLFAEPCAGDGTLMRQLEAAGHVCTHAYDIEPRDPEVVKFDALTHRPQGMQCFISNPPWTRELLHPLIIHLSDMAPTWLLFDSDWAFNKTQVPPFVSRLRKIVPVGRLKWIPASEHDGKDNCAWYLFEAPAKVNPQTLFYVGANVRAAA